MKENRVNFICSANKRGIKQNIKDDKYITIVIYDFIF